MRKARDGSNLILWLLHWPAREAEYWLKKLWFFHVLPWLGFTCEGELVNWNSLKKCGTIDIKVFADATKWKRISRNDFENVDSGEVITVHGDECIAFIEKTMAEQPGR